MESLKGFKNCKLVLANQIIEQGFIRFNNGVIESLGNVNEAGIDTLNSLTDISGHYVLPGFIDLHCHGGQGSDVMDATCSDLNTISLFHAQGGTTAFLATTASESKQNILSAIENVKNHKDKISGAQILGIHLEGPYLHPGKKGCHLPEHVRLPDKAEYIKFIDSDLITLVTLAPDIEGSSELIKELVKRNIIVSLGHTEASYQQVRDSIKLGATHVTHMYCAMSSIIRKGPMRSGGLVEATLLEDSLTTEIIADGIHLPDELIRLILKAKGIKNVCVVTDAMRGAGMPDGIYTFGSKSGSKAKVSNGMSIMMDNSGMSSSVYRMIDMFHYLIKVIGLDLNSAAALFSINPARIINKNNITGSIEKGKQADLIVLDQKYILKHTIVKGNMIEINKN